MECGKGERNESKFILYTGKSLSLIFYHYYFLLGRKTAAGISDRHRKKQIAGFCFKFQDSPRGPSFSGRPPSLWASGVRFGSSLRAVLFPGTLEMVLIP